ncbi:MAG: sensor histidine kinase, partial [Steroidobacteraceae bacterium]
AVGGAPGGAGAGAGADAGPAEATMPAAGASVQEADVERLIGTRLSRWWTLAGIWLAVAFSVGFGLYVNFQAQGREVSLGDALMAMIPHYCFWVLVSPAIYRSLHKTIEGGRRGLWLSMLLGWSAIALAGSTAMSYLSYIVRHDLGLDLGQLIDIYILPPAGPAFLAMNVSILALALAGFAMVRGLRLRDQALWGKAKAELRRARLEAQLSDARLMVLQSQINPHFLLNSLNSIAGLVQIGERERAFDAIGRLGELLRVALENGRDLNVTLGDEMDFLQRYLGLCELRFDSRFRYCVSVPAALRARRVPALIVQPLIENAIRHGMEPLRPLNVDIRAYEQGDRTVIEVEDDGRGIGPETSASLPAGHGLANVAERLRLFFGDASRLSLEPRESGGTRARIVVPHRGIGESSGTAD